ncbi:MAG: type I-C CRISPR-associated protein Cas8c/Csd1 [Chitinispirillaceae bacterium]|nr:type I-C CRISPR-associated protein Cas8c/Csd1 [Chitinispirillaceae bacterium]
MSWIKHLYDTYNANSKNIGDVNDAVPLLPLCHTIQNAHIQITIDNDGNFLRAAVVKKENAPTIIPCTEGSSSRAGKKPKGHPLCDSLQFIAGDFVKYGGNVTSGYAKEPGFPHSNYLKELNDWCISPHNHPKVTSVLKYVKKHCVIEDLVKQKILYTDVNNTLIKGKTKEQLKELFGSVDTIPEIFHLIQPDQADKTIDQSSAFIRWCVEIPGNLETEVWNDKSLWQCWIDIFSESESSEGICYVTGINGRLGKNHPKRIRKGNDNAKFISIPCDKSFITFQGRFTDDLGEQASGVSFEVSQKAHSALRWLIGRKQAFKNGDQVIVSWALNGQEIPDPLSNTFDLFVNENTSLDTVMDYESDIGQSFSQKLNKLIAGYSVKLGSTNNIIVLGIDSASPGRLSITYYRELTGSEFLVRIEGWHSALAWKQRIVIEDANGKRKTTKTIWPTCAPSPKSIALAAFGRRVDEKLKKATVERLLPCIIDGLQLPRDIVDATVHRACNRAGLEQWEWEEVLGVVCSLYKGYYLRNQKDQRSYSMALETDRTTRDYLYGRLLAAADLLESVALHVTEKSRPTTAARLMQRFADRPFSTWRTIELSLVPYRARLKGQTKYDKTITEVLALFNHDDFILDKQLSGEFLLGYHCQRTAFKLTDKNAVNQNLADEDETIEIE